MTKFLFSSSANCLLRGLATIAANIQDLFHSYIHPILPNNSPNSSFTNTYDIEISEGTICIFIMSLAIKKQ